MAIPSGYGSEILKSETDDARTTGSFEPVDLTVSGIWTATVLSIIICNVHLTEDALMNIILHDGTNGILLVNQQSVPAKSTFVFSDRFVVADGCKLQINRETASGTYDTTVSYILQDWTT